MKLTQIEFNQRRQRGWNPISPENIPLIQHDEDPAELSNEIVVGYMWSEKEFDDILEIGQTLDKPGDVNLYGSAGSRPINEYGEGYIYTHRDITEAIDLWDWMERGKLYEVRGYGFDRENFGLVSAGALDQIERIFPVSEVISCRELTRDEAEELPTLWERLTPMNKED